MAALPADAAAPKAKFNKGDRVRSMRLHPEDGLELTLAQPHTLSIPPQVVFLKGELQNLEAVVTDVTVDGKILVQPKIEGFEETVDCDPEELMKFFEVSLGGRVEG